MDAQYSIKALLALLSREMPDVNFTEAYGVEPADRLPGKVQVIAGIGLEKEDSAKGERVIQLDICLPPKSEPDAAETVLRRISSVVKEAVPALSGVSRKAVQQDAYTGGLIIPCTLTLQTGGIHEESAVVCINGEKRRAGGVKLALSRKNRELTAFGEAAPYRVIPGKTLYTVQLTGFTCTGLAGLTDFTAAIEQNGTAVFTHCNWLSLCEQDQKAEFSSYERKEVNA